jgi:hypothetical protein
MNADRNDTITSPCLAGKSGQKTEVSLTEVNDKIQIEDIQPDKGGKTTINRCAVF